MHDQFSSEGIVLDNALAFWIHRVYQATRNATFRSFRAQGEEITPEQWIVLARLWESDGRTETELGEATYRDRPTMSRILDGMEKRGLLARRADANNARVWRIYLTPGGKGLKKELVPLARELVQRSLAGISRKDLETTRAVLKKMFSNLTES